ncbi:hypothetical protein PIB30_044849, partial [Stylosanthes scabra]|nr:hypothetical protein [Stylosanthes scabra]
MDRLHKSSVIGLICCLTNCGFGKSSSDELFWAELMTGQITVPKLDLIGIGRQTDENGKSVVPIAVGDRYSWVKGEVREMASLFVDMESIVMGLSASIPNRSSNTTVKW